MPASIMGPVSTLILPYLLLLLLGGPPHLATAAINIEEGGLLEDDYTIRIWDSPVLIRNNLFVGEHATLTVEPGAEVRFAPAVMLAVNGTLKADV